MSREARAGQNKSMAAIFCGSFQAVNLHKGIQTYEANQRTNEHTHTPLRTTIIHFTLFSTNYL